MFGESIIQPIGKKTGFTLIEILVVIAIIAIISSILFPVFARARENARSTTCKSNLKQIALGYLQYNQDYDGRFPNSHAGTGNASGYERGWALALQPYIKSTQVLSCPSDPYRYTVGAPGTPEWFYTTYWSNGYLNSQPGGPNTPLVGISEASLTAPALTILTGDGTAEFGAAFHNFCGNGNQTGWGSTLIYPCSAPGDVRTLARLPAGQRHFNGSNYAFTDGHVKFIAAASRTTSSSITSGYGSASDSGGRFTFGT